MPNMQPLTADEERELDELIAWAEDFGMGMWLDFDDPDTQAKVARHDELLRRRVNAEGSA